MMQSTLVTGNNQKKTISEFKTNDFTSLKPSLCTLVIHSTTDLLYYGVFFNNQCKYLKKLDWSENYSETLSKEFNQQDAFYAVHVLIHGKQSTIIPKSLFTSKNSHFGLTNTLPATKIEATNLDSNKKLILAIPESIINSIYKVFPEATIHSTIAPLFHSLPSTGIHIGIVNEKESTQILISQDNKIILSENYTCPTSTEILFFTLSALKVNQIEDQSLCTFHLCCDKNGKEVYTLFKEYFENIIEVHQEVNSFGFPLVSQDLNDFQIILNALSCVS